MSKTMAAGCIAITIALTVYGQLVVKWQVIDAGNIPSTWGDRFSFLGRLLINPWVISCFAAGGLAALFYISALTRFDLSVAYPFMSLSFVAVLILSSVFFGEAITPLKTVGIGLIIAGLAVGAQS
jgi:multidrug transporter EmrE-like cation transporter